MSTDAVAVVQSTAGGPRLRLCSRYGIVPTGAAPSSLPRSEQDLRRDMPLFTLLHKLSVMQHTDSDDGLTVVRIPIPEASLLAAPRTRLEAEMTAPPRVPEGDMGDAEEEEEAARALQSDIDQLTLNFSSPFTHTDIRVVPFCSYERVYRSLDAPSAGSAASRRPLDPTAFTPSARQLRASFPLPLPAPSPALIVEHAPGAAPVYAAAAVACPRTMAPFSVYWSDLPCSPRPAPPAAAGDTPASASGAGLQSPTSAFGPAPPAPAGPSPTTSGASAPATTAAAAATTAEAEASAAAARAAGAAIAAADESFAAVAARAAAGVIRAHVSDDDAAAPSGLLWRLDFLSPPRLTTQRPESVVRLIDSSYVGGNYESFLRFTGYVRDFEYILYGFRFSVGMGVEVTVSQTFRIPAGGKLHEASQTGERKWLVELRGVAPEDGVGDLEARMKVYREALAPLQLFVVDLAALMRR